ncbi:MAG: DUF3093 family protein [Microbacterium sp.]
MHPVTRELNGSYRERLSPSLRTLAVTAVLVPMAALVFTPLGAAVGLAIGIAVAIAAIALLLAAAPTIRVVDGELRAGRAHISVDDLGDPVALTGEDASSARGVGIDRTGWFLVRGGIDGVVRMADLDDDDPVTSWTVSSRTPDRLAAAIRSAKAR